MPALCRAILTALLLFGSVTTHAAEVQVAVAANFTEPAKAIAKAFAKATGHQANLSFGPSGGLYTQVTHGAPYELLLSADAERPAQLDKDGLTAPGTRFTYAIGRLVLYSTQPRLADAGERALRTGSFTRLAIADPVAAPYGLAAIQTLDRLGLGASLAPKLVRGNSIAQAYQFVATGAAELGFVSLAQVIGRPGGSRWLVPARLHDPIDQQAVLLKTGAANSAARAFHRFLQSAAARAIIKRYGYGLPGAPR